MSTVFTEPPRMAGRKKENFDRRRVEFMAEPDWIERANDEALRSGHGNLSAFIRVVVTAYLDRIDAERRDSRRRRDK
jgi:hypothetical protein